MGVAGQEIAVCARGLAEDDPLDTQVAEPGHQLGVFKKVREID